MSTLKSTSIIQKYSVSLDTVKRLFAKDLDVPAEELHVDYVIGDTGPCDPMDRFPTPRGVVRIEVTHTKKGN